MLAVPGLMALTGCVLCSVHPDSSGWEDLFARDFSNAEVKPGLQGVHGKTGVRFKYLRIRSL